MTSMKEAIEKITSRKDLEPGLAREAMGELMKGDSPSTNVGAFLAGLKSKGETAGEIAAFADVMRKKSIKINPNVPESLIDLCGTGGSELKTFNISTISSFIVAGAGFPVAKHGNRSNTSQSGSADLLEALGVNLKANPEEVERSIEELGIGFLYAPNLHPAMKHAAGPREKLGIRTVFNLLGPLTNPASASRHLMGVYEKNLVDKFPKVLDKLGVERAMVVHGLEGIDEISTVGETYVGELSEGDISCYRIHPEDFGLPEADPEEIGDLSPRESALLTIKILRGEEKGKARDIVLLNAGAGIYVAGGGESIQEGIDIAKRTIETGSAYSALKKLIRKVGSKDRLSELEEEITGNEPL